MDDPPIRPYYIVFLETVCLCTYRVMWAYLQYVDCPPVDSKFVKWKRANAKHFHFSCLISLRVGAHGFEVVERPSKEEADIGIRFRDCSGGC